VEDSAASARTIISNRTQVLVALEQTQIRTQVCPTLFYLSNIFLPAMSYPEEPWISARTHHLLESCLLGTGTGFGSTANTGGFGSTNTTGGGLFGGGSTGFGSTGGMSTMLSCSGNFCWSRYRMTLSQISMSPATWLSKFTFFLYVFFSGFSND
jgi:hypothetical protein